MSSLKNSSGASYFFSLGPRLALHFACHVDRPGQGWGSDEQPLQMVMVMESIWIVPENNQKNLEKYGKWLNDVKWWISMDIPLSGYQKLSGWFQPFADPKKKKGPPLKNTNRSNSNQSSEVTTWGCDQIVQNPCITLTIYTYNIHIIYI